MTVCLCVESEVNAEAVWHFSVVTRFYCIVFYFMRYRSVDTRRGMVQRFFFTKSQTNTHAEKTWFSRKKSKIKQGLLDNCWTMSTKYLQFFQRGRMWVGSGAQCPCSAVGKPDEGGGNKAGAESKPILFLPSSVCRASRGVSTASLRNSHFFAVRSLIIL